MKIKDQQARQDIDKMNDKEERERVGVCVRDRLSVTQATAKEKKERKKKKTARKAQ